MLDLAFLIGRCVVGLLMFGHGAQKLFGWFGGHGLAGTSGYFSQVGLRPGKLFAVLVGALETLGGLSLLLGLATPVGAVAVAAVMFGAIAFVHAPHGLWIANGGAEYNLVMLVLMTLFGLVGPGVYSLDEYLALGLANSSIYLAGFVLTLVAVLLVRWLASSQTAGQPRAKAA